MTTTVFLGLGSNLGDRRAALRAAVAGLAPAVRVDAVSPVYETAPMYVTDQPAFLNCALRGETDLAPAALLAALKRLEAALGRVPGRRFGPRAIDLDILLYGCDRIALPELELPHPRLAERPFVLIPLRDLAPDLVHPVLGRTVADLASTLPGGDSVRPVGALD